MTKPVLYALILTGSAAMADPCAPPEIARGRTPSERLPVIGERVRTVYIREKVCPPPPGVAERVSRENLAYPARSYSGVAVRFLTAPNKAQMINPLAPPEYGSARNLVEYTIRDVYRTSNINKYELQPNGIRLFTIRPLW